MQAVFDGDQRQFQTLLAAGANVNARDADGWTALAYAAVNQRQQMAQALLAAGADVSATDKDGVTALMRAASNEKLLELMQALLAAGADVNATDKNGLTALTYAVRKASPEVVRVLLAARADVNATDKNGWTALMHTAEKGTPQIVQLLVAAGADVNAAQKDGATALMVAAGNERPDQVQALLAAGANVNASEKDGWTALTFAVRKASPEVVRVLLAARADVNATENDGWTALMNAAEKGTPQIVQLLVAAGANVNTAKKDGLTALMVAASNERLELVQALLAAGANVNAKANSGSTALSLARAKGNTKIAELIEKAAASGGASTSAPASTVIATGHNHTCALTRTGGVKCWGETLGGALGDGTMTDRHTPVDVVGLSSGAASLSAGWGYTCALMATGNVKCWGFNASGEIGDGTTTSRLTPVDVVGLGSGAVSISSGYQHVCALTKAGGVKCWGENEKGQLGDGTTTDRHTPIDVVGLGLGAVSISSGYQHVCALTTAGGVKCWGENEEGQLGDGTTTDRQRPVDVIGLRSGVTAISAGANHTCALMATGGVKCWGWNIGQLGYETTGGNSTSPGDVVGLSSGVASIAASRGHTCALMKTGSVKCWGWNKDGQLGDGTTDFRRTPVDVVGLSSGVTSIAGTWKHTCALMTTGRAKCWGKNEYGQLGDGTTTDRHTPVDVVFR
jgi:ankyrin repeat protein/alpha-tubulin suppressor-like RCC1 family protein